MSTSESAPDMERIRQAGTLSGWLVLGHAACWILLLVTVLTVVPRFEEMFRDFGLDLRPITVLLIEAARAVGRALPVAALFLGCLLMADWIILGHFAEAGRRGWRAAWSALMFAVPLVGLAVAAVAIGVAYFELSQAMHLVG